MKPVRTGYTDMVYRGPNPDVGDLWCQRVEPGCIASIWEPDEEERAALAAGGRVRLVLWSEPIPPICLDVLTDEESTPVGDHHFKVIPELEER
jgi:hypothetical protein